MFFYYNILSSIIALFYLTIINLILIKKVISSYKSIIFSFIISIIIYFICLFLLKYSNGLDKNLFKTLFYIYIDYYFYNISIFIYTHIANSIYYLMSLFYQIKLKNRLNPI